MGAIAITASLGLVPAAARAHGSAHPAPAWLHAANPGWPIRWAPAPRPSLWLDRSDNWVAQRATQFNVYVAARDPRLRFWLSWYVHAWSRRTVLEMRVVGDPRVANVIAYEGHYGRRAVAGWTRVCAGCGRSEIHFNLDQVRHSPILRHPRHLGAVACQELGHVAGLWHGGGDCMSFGYHRTSTFGIGRGNAWLVNAAYRRVPRGLPGRLGLRSSSVSRPAPAQ